jgi:hypothetical protein
MKKQLHKIKIAAENFSQRFVLVFFLLSINFPVRVLQNIFYKSHKSKLMHALLCHMIINDKSVIHLCVK